MAAPPNPPPPELAPADPAPGAAPAGPPPRDEPAAWARVEAAWTSPEAHRAYLDRCPDLDALATAGRRYREALAARPGDPVAAAMKAEVLKRATVVGLAMLPRTAPPAPTGRWKRLALLLSAAWLAAALAFLLWKLLTGPAP